MNELVFTVGLLLSGPQAATPTADTIDVSDSFLRLAAVFQNCSFSAVQTHKAVRANGRQFTRIDHVRCKACADAVVLHFETLLKDQWTPSGKRHVDSTAYEERRWIRDQPRFSLELEVRDAKTWLLPPSNRKNVSVTSVIQSPKRDDDAKIVWEPLIVGDFLKGTITPGGAFSDLVSGREPWKYKIEDTTKPSTNGVPSVTYRFASSEYGSMTVVLSKVGHWKPTRIHQVKSSQHKVYPEFVAARNRVENYQDFNSFSQPTNGLDQYEQSYEITYSQWAGGQVLPARMKYNLIRTWHRERLTDDITLVFKDFRSGDVSCNDVIASMLPIPDGTDAFMARVPGLDKVAWTTKDEKVVKKIDPLAATIGRTAAFSSTRRLALIVTWNVVALLAAAILYRRFHLANKG